MAGKACANLGGYKNRTHHGGDLSRRSWRPATGVGLKTGSTIMSNIIDMVRDGQTVKFVHALRGNLIYETENGFRFRVPINEMDDACFLATDKAIMYLRWIRREYDAVIEEERMCREQVVSS